MEPFLLRALVAGVGLAVVAAPLGCFLVWSRMAFFGETVAQASLIGIAIGLAFHIDLTAAALGVALIASVILVALGRQRMVPIDSVLSVLAHASLAAGVVATALVRGRSVDLTGYLFGDIFSVTKGDLVWLGVVCVVVAAVMSQLWRSLLSMAVHEELAAAEGIDIERHKLALALVLALVIAVAMKVVGILLTVAFLIMPAVAARPLSSTPEGMAITAAAVGAAAVGAGLALSWQLDAPGGPSIVVVMAITAGLALGLAGLRRR